MSRAAVELSWELLTGDGVVRVGVDAADGAARWGLRDPGERSPHERDRADDDLGDIELVGGAR